MTSFGDTISQLINSLFLGLLQYSHPYLVVVVIKYRYTKIYQPNCFEVYYFCVGNAQCKTITTISMLKIYSSLMIHDLIVFFLIVAYMCRYEFTNIALNIAKPVCILLLLCIFLGLMICY